MVGLPSAHAFRTNSFRFEQMPVKWWYNPTHEPPAPPGTSWEALIAEAADNWASVTCAEVSFVYEGHTDAEWDNDGINTVYWQAGEVWNWGAGAAAATLHIPQLSGQPREVDLVLNGLDFVWSVGGGDALETYVLDPESVFTHELGHWLGLAHSSDQFATMYQAKLIGQMQASLDSDDKFGLCSLYPGGADECAADSDCPDGWECRSHESLRMCGEKHDPAGAPCSKDRLNCEGMCFITFWDCSALCAYTEQDLSEGYCAPLCRTPDGATSACPDGYSCTDVPGHDVKACYVLPEPDEPSADEVEPSERDAYGAPESHPDGDHAGAAAEGCTAGYPQHPGSTSFILWMYAMILLGAVRRASPAA